MIIEKSNLFTYLLIDNGLLHENSKHYTEVDRESRPAWLTPVYTERALAVSPLLIDIEFAFETGDIDQVMIYVNALKPALHLSIIETELDLDALTQHLKRFIFIVDPEGRQFTLRYADCSVLASLSTLLTIDQWVTMRLPTVRWSVHDRSGELVSLPAIESATRVQTPLRLSHAQLVALDEVSEPDHCIAKIKTMRYGVTLPGDALDQYKWAHAARRAWLSADNPNQLILISLTESVIKTHGKLLDRHDLQDWLTITDTNLFREKIRSINYNTF